MEKMNLPQCLKKWIFLFWKWACGWCKEWLYVLSNLIYLKKNVIEFLCIEMYVRAKAHITLHDY